MTRPVAGGSDLAPRSGPRLVLHVGLPKTGTTYLQELMSRHREGLHEAGVLYPDAGPQAMFLGAVEVRGSHEKFGLTADQVAGRWQAVADLVRGHDGPSVVSHEILGGADLDEIAWALAPYDGLRVDVVVTARDLGRQATAHWQEEVKLGDTRSFADFEREQFRADTVPDLVPDLVPDHVPDHGPDHGPDAGPDRPHFWHAQDYAAALRRWSSVVPPDRVHLVVCPAAGAPPAVLWERFARAADIEAAAHAVDTSSASPANPSLTTEAVAVLRALNQRLAGQLTPREHARLVKRDVGEGLLAQRTGTPARTPAALGSVLGPAAARWRSEIEGSAHPVVGDLDELEPVLGGPGDPHPDDVPPGVPDPDEVAALADEVLRRVADLRVDSRHEGTGNSGGDGPAGPARARQRLWRRLGLRGR